MSATSSNASKQEIECSLQRELSKRWSKALNINK